MGSGKGREGKGRPPSPVRLVPSRLLLRSALTLPERDYFTYYHTTLPPYSLHLASADALITHSLTPSLTPTLPHSHTPTLPHSLNHSYTLSLSLTPSAIDNNSDGVGTDQGMNGFKRLISTLPQGQTDTCRVYLQCEN